LLKTVYNQSFWKIRGIPQNIYLMIRKIISLYRIWKLKRELVAINREIDDFYINLTWRHDRLQTDLDIEKLYQRFVNLKNVEVRGINRLIKELKK